MYFFFFLTLLTWLGGQLINVGMKCITRHNTEKKFEQNFNKEQNYPKFITFELELSSTRYKIL